MPLLQPRYFDRVMESSTTTGTGTYTLAGALTGYQPFSVVGDGKPAYYCAVAVDGAGLPSGGWEIGLGTYTLAGTLLARTAILTSSNAGAVVNWAAGTKRIALVQPASTLPQVAVYVAAHAEILTWPTTPFIITPAPGAAKYIAGMRVDVTAKIAVAGDYGNIDPEAWINIHTLDWQAEIWSYLVNGNATGLTRVNDFLKVASQTALWSPLRFASGEADPGTAFTTDWGLVAPLVDLAGAANQPYEAYFDNAIAGNLTGGNATNTITFVTRYQLVDVP